MKEAETGALTLRNMMRDAFCCWKMQDGWRRADERRARSATTNVSFPQRSGKACVSLGHELIGNRIRVGEGGNEKETYAENVSFLLGVHAWLKLSLRRSFGLRVTRGSERDKKGNECSDRPSGYR